MNKTIRKKLNINSESITFLANAVQNFRLSLAGKVNSLNIANNEHGGNCNSFLFV